MINIFKPWQLRHSLVNNFRTSVSTSSQSSATSSSSAIPPRDASCPEPSSKGHRDKGSSALIRAHQTTDRWVSNWCPPYPRGKPNSNLCSSEAFVCLHAENSGWKMGKKTKVPPSSIDSIVCCVWSLHVPCTDLWLCIIFSFSVFIKY